ncbi:MAG: membrane protein insertase YidC [bacterium]|nr:membrane protein insertase YidC [bacterium]
MNARLFLFLFLSLIILFLHSLWLQHQQPPLPPTKPSTEPKQKEEVILPKTETRAKISIPVEEMKIKSGLFELTLLSDGKIGTLSLLKFTKQGKLYPVLIPENSCFSLKVGEEELLPITSSLKTMEFGYMAGKIEIKKSYSFDPDSYLFKTNLTFTNTSKEAIVTPPILLCLSSLLGQDVASHSSPQGYLVNNSFKDVKYSGGGFLEGIGLKEETPLYQKIKIDTPADWLVQRDKYFIFSAKPKMRSQSAYFIRDLDKSYRIEAEFSGYLLEGGKSIENLIEVYIGPKDNKELSKFGLVKLSGLWFLAKWILYCLSFLYKVVGNYGLAIILLTIIIKIVLHPLTRKNFKAMKAMAKLKPHMERLKEKHKDPKILQEETMKLYQEHKVNPFGGCLPLLLQMPVFFALYSAFDNGIELRGAPFIFWIQDLSAKDPYFVLPILMGVSMFIQQKMSPSPGGDASTEKIMMIMPIIMTFMFLQFPSGLVLYWFIQNIVTIIEHWLIEKGIEK